jgi:hypothetical protein
MMKKENVKKEMTGLVLSVFMGLFGTGVMAEDSSKTSDIKSEATTQIDSKKLQK